MLVSRHTVFETRALVETPDGHERYAVSEGSMAAAMKQAKKLFMETDVPCRIEVVYRDIPRRKDISTIAEFEK